MFKNILLCLRMPENFDAVLAIQEVADEIEDDSGSAGEIDWNILDTSTLVEIDPRQQKAAAALLLGFDLPADMMAVAQSMLLGAIIDPKATVGEMGRDNRKAQLLRARGLIDEMLEEIKDAP